MNAIIAKSITPTPSDLEQINAFTRRDLTLDEVYTFSVILCDNEIDRDNERFSESSLAELAKLFIGTTGIFDHNPTGQNQSARIYATEVIADDQQKNSLGAPYTHLKAKVYMVRSEKNAALILDIDGGIKKEVSVSCTVDSIICSICGKDRKQERCEHQKGKQYDGKTCYHVLEHPSDAYEWSFVAIPAQKKAGVIKSMTKKSDIISREEVTIMKNFDDVLKRFSSGEESVTISNSEAAALSELISELKEQATLGKAYKDDLAKEVKRLAFVANDGLPADVMDSVTNKLTISELIAYKKSYEQRVSKLVDTVQLKPASSTQSSTNEFKM